MCSERFVNEGVESGPTGIEDEGEIGEVKGGDKGEGDTGEDEAKRRQDHGDDGGRSGRRRRRRRRCRAERRQTCRRWSLIAVYFCAKTGACTAARPTDTRTFIL